jgi:ABC-2 type transport system permease protein
MGKYLLILKSSIQRNLIYRFNTFSFLFIQIFIFAVFFYLWSSIYRSGGQIGNYELGELITYYLVVNFLILIIKSDVAWRVGDEIRLGTMTSLLLRPISYFGYIFSRTLGDIVFSGTVYSVSFLILILFLNDFLNISLSLTQVFYFITSVVLGAGIYFLFFYIIGLTTFWLGFVWGFNFAMQMIVSFLEGSIIPLDLLPEFIIKISEFLPFKYIVFIPISIFTNRIELTPNLLVVPFCWIVVLYIISLIVFKKGIKKYEGYGA